MKAKLFDLFIKTENSTKVIREISDTQIVLLIAKIESKPGRIIERSA